MKFWVAMLLVNVVGLTLVLVNGEPVASLPSLIGVAGSALMLASGETAPPAAREFWRALTDVFRALVAAIQWPWDRLAALRSPEPASKPVDAASVVCTCGSTEPPAPIITATVLGIPGVTVGHLCPDCREARSPAPERPVPPKGPGGGSRPSDVFALKPKGAYADQIAVLKAALAVKRAEVDAVAETWKAQGPNVVLSKADHDRYLAGVTEAIHVRERIAAMVRAHVHDWATARDGTGFMEVCECGEKRAKHRHTWTTEEEVVRSHGGEIIRTVRTEVCPCGAIHRYSPKPPTFDHVRH